MSVIASEHSIEACVFENNSAADHGGGLFVSSSAEVDASACDFAGNDPDDLYHYDLGTYTWDEEISFSCDPTGCE